VTVSPEGSSTPAPSGVSGVGAKRSSDQPVSERGTVNHFVSNRRVRRQGASAVLPPEVAPLMTRFARFSLQYDLESVGPSGVRTVHLWCTQDGGHTWTQWTEDEDRTSPILVDVEREGVYGFRIVVENNDGLSVSPPQEGDSAEIWVGVDYTSPQAQLTSAQYGKGARAGRLEIQWKASDDHLAEKPVTIKYASNPTTGWQTVAKDLDNTGQYSWRVDRHVPQEVYLRLEVADRAGNLGVHQLQQPISTRGLVPKARIRGMSPISDSDPRAHPASSK
jgi:hypothetical protein